jgi:ribulose-bisphosphate carboxylase large chain
MGYLNLDYTPGKDEIICKFYIEPAYGVEREYVLEQLAAESSVGTWTELTTMKPEIRNRLAAHAFRVEGDLVYVSYPFEAFEHGNVSQLLASIAGNIFGLDALSNLRLLDISFPVKMTKQFPGPRYGIRGLRKLLGVTKRPFLGTIIKPKMGLSPREHARVAYEAWMGGCDLVKDDENLTNQSFNPFKKRVESTLNMKEKAEDKTGEKKGYIVNITAPSVEELYSRQDFVLEHGGQYVMLDVIIAGYLTLQSLRNRNLESAIHAHRAMHAAFTRNRKHGIHMAVLAKVLRLSGVDQLHIGSLLGKMEGSREEVLYSKDVLTQKWKNIKRVLPVASGGLNPVLIPGLIEGFGRDFVIQMGGGIHGHPMGSRAGAKAARDALDAALEGIPLKNYATKELLAAMDKWG